MYQSLKQHCTSFHLYVFAFDDLAHQTLNTMQLPHATVISLADFEDEQLLTVKPTRTAGEYCWTCTSSTIRYCIQTYGLDACTYIDADLLFFADPSVLIEEMEDRSVLITSHRYSPAYDQSATSGTYCVQFICFKNTEDGMSALNWWREACLAWCYNRIEDGKFGDQKYLDDWPNRFSGVHELQHIGGGVGPWNIQQYDFSYRNGSLMGKELASGKDFPVIFYHYHGFRYAEADAFIPAPNYQLSKNDLKHIYSPYVKALTSVERELKEKRMSQQFHETVEIPRIRKSIRRMYKLYISGHFREFYHRSYFSR